jgi:hypothetical protein
MRTFRTYRDLLESDLADEFIFETIVSRQVLPFLVSLFFWHYTSDLLLFSIPLVSLYYRRWISDLWIRRILTCSLLVFSWLSQSWFWVGLISSTELIRFVLIYGVPLFLRRVSEEMPRDPAAETALKKSIQLIRKLRTQGMTQSINEYLTIYMQYRQGDQSESFSAEERSRFERFFRDFSKTALVVGERLTFFFPSFTVRFGPTGIELDSESAMKLIEGPRSEFCSICQGTVSDPGIKLNCQHYYCLGCLPSWLDQKRDCPVCRQPLS